MRMKTSNIALSALVLLLLTSMAWVNTRLKKVYAEIDLTDKLRSYLPLEVGKFRVLKISGSNGYPIDIRSGETEGIQVLRSRVSQFEHKMIGDTLFIHFSGARVSPAALPNTTTPAGLIISSAKLKDMILTNTHNRISGLDQGDLSLTLSGSSYTELLDNSLNRLTVTANDASSFEFRNENRAHTAEISLNDQAVGFLDGLRYHELKPVMEDSALVVLSKNALNQLVKK